MEETSVKKPDKDRENKHNSKISGTDESLSLSLTPPFPEDNKKENDRSYESISEHLTSNSGSVENDRSYQEIEISNRPANVLFNLDSSDEEQRRISQEPKPRSLETSFCSENSVISLNFLDRIDVRNTEIRSNVRSILEEILSNEQFESDQAAPTSSSDNSRDESLNIFKDVDLDDRSLSNFRTRDDSLNEKNLLGSNFGMPFGRRESNIDKRIKDFEELIVIKDNTIAALTSELDSYRELSNTNSTSMVSTTEYRQLQEECHNKLLEYNSAIIYKNDLIQQLSESLDQSISERRELLKQEVEKQSSDCCDSTRTNDWNYLDLEENLNSEQKSLLLGLKNKIDEFINVNITKNKNVYEEQIDKLKKEKIVEKEDY
ncbi:hypothetical protein NQ318_002128 [Aromia moschata]|uniref:Uncharacterized protein n=1 Tax=Aromia moschata TaxID=1265417 RepID=A0AAV8Y1N0_9CUCU|nr:hypothetical protein NQ318_002128 [Aromia moschata]